METTKTSLVFPGDDHENDNGDSYEKHLRLLVKLSENNLAAISALREQEAERDRTLNIYGSRLSSLEDRVTENEQSKPMAPKDCRAIRSRVAKRIYGILGLKKVGGKLSDESKRVSKVYSPLFFSRLYSDLNNKFGVSEYGEIRAIDREKAESFIDTWEPSCGFEELRREAEENWSVNHPEYNVYEFLGRLC